MSSSEPLHHACSHSQETMCVSSSEPLHHACSHSQETMGVYSPESVYNACYHNQESMGVSSPMIYAPLPLLHDSSFYMITVGRHAVYMLMFTDAQFHCHRSDGRSECATACEAPMVECMNDNPDNSCSEDKYLCCCNPPP